MTIRTLIVDDEELARRGIRARLERFADIAVIGERVNGREAIESIKNDAPDLVFLDVQMPGLGGFEVVAAVGPERMPVVVFVTAYDEFALRAFDAQALDYLLKPIDDERFAETLNRVRRRLAERAESVIGRRVNALLGEQSDRATAATSESTATMAPSGLGIPTSQDQDAEPERKSLAHILVRDRGRVLILEIPGIDWVEADGDYVRLHSAGRAHLLRETMATMQASLREYRFARVHRSAIVNVARIVELRPLTSREYEVVLQDGTRLRLSRRYRERLRGVVGEQI
ncbi:MAG: response regulator [Gemmatimonadaceae bacterium]